MELVGNYKGNYMDTYGGSGLTSETCSAFSDLSPDQKQSRPAAFQRINAESSSLLCHFNKPPKIQVGGNCLLSAACVWQFCPNVGYWTQFFWGGRYKNMSETRGKVSHKRCSVR